MQLLKQDVLGRMDLQKPIRIVGDANLTAPFELPCIQYEWATNRSILMPDLR